MRYLLTCVCAFLLVMGVATARAISRTRGTGRAMVFLAIRLVAITLLVYLGYRALGDFRKRDVTQSHERKRQVVVVEDRSSSMDFPANETTRKTIAGGSLEVIERRLANEPDFELSHVVFADNFVDVAFAADLRRDSSRISNAVTGVLTRYRADAIIVVSDGAGTDGDPPDYLLDWAVNRKVGIYAVGIGEETDSFDVRLAKVVGAMDNPDVLTVHLQCRGGTMPDRLLVRLLVDGKLVHSQRVEPLAMNTVTFALPKVAEGWHEYSAEVVSPIAETCVKNNRRMGVFRRSPPKKILFLYTSPSADYRHLSSFLRILYPGRVDAASTADDRVDDLGPEDVVFLVLGDVAPQALPRRLHDALVAGRLPTLFLPGDNLTKWTRADVPTFPLAAVGPYRNAMKIGARVIRAGRLGWCGGEFDHLRPTGFRQATARKGAVQLLSLRTDEKVFPFLVADSAKNARLICLLSSSSWRWSLSPEPQIRSSFRGLWRRITAMAIDSPESMQSLKLSVERGRGGNLEVIVRHENESRTAALKDLVVIQTGPTTAKLDGFRLKSKIWMRETAMPAECPSISWFKATATLDGLAIESEVVATIVNPDGSEFIDTIPHHARLRALLSDATTDFSTADGVDGLMDQVMADTRIIPSQEVVRHREWRLELTIGLIMLLLFCTDWLLERNLKEGR